MIKKTTDYQPGFMLLALVIGFSAITVISLAVTLVAVTNFKMGIADRDLTHTQLAIDAALAEAQVAIKADANWTGTTTPVDYHTANNTRIAYSSTVTTPTADTKQLAITANIYRPATATTPTETKKAKVSFKKTSTSGSSTLHNYAVITGAGSLTISNGSDIYGDVYANGTVSIGTYSEIGDDDRSPIKLRVAHAVCGNPAVGPYPRVCNTGELPGQPIVMASSADIYGEVHANNQTNGTNMVDSGLQLGVAVDYAPLPDPAPIRQNLITANAASGVADMTAAAASCNGGNRTWPANVKIIGNVTVSGGCSVRVEGSAWITGNLTIINGSDLTVAPGVATPPVLMVDGAGSPSVTITDFSEIMPNSAGIGCRVITYYATGCGACGSVSGTVLANNINRTTILLSDGSDSPKSEFYAAWSKMTVSDGSSLGSAMAQSLTMDSGGGIDFTGKATGFVVPGATVDTWQMTAYQNDY